MGGSAARRFGLAAIASFLAGSTLGLAAVEDPFPEVRPATREQAVGIVADRAAGSGVCLTLSRTEASERGVVLRRALDILARSDPGFREQGLAGPAGIPVHVGFDLTAAGSLRSGDADRNGVPDVVQATLLGLGQAAGLLFDVLDLPRPTVDVRILDLGGAADGFVAPGESGAPLLVLDAFPGESPDRTRRAAIHQLSHVVAEQIGTGLSPAWAEAFAVWTVLTIDGVPTASERDALDVRLARLHEGLLAADSRLAAGNALWLEYLDEAYGPATLRAALQELGQGRPVDAAFERALRGTSNDDLAAALRDFQLWTVFVGDRADGRHFRLAPMLSTPRFASSAEGLPALSVEADPAVAPLGTALVRIVPDSGEGGLRVRFEGGFGARWEADLLLRGTRGQFHRLPLHVSAEGRAETTVPLDGLAEALLLVRNLGGEDGAAHRYTYAAHRAKGYPFELASFEASVEPRSGDVLVSWETAAEQGLFAFNVVRTWEGGGQPQVLNPVWIPAVGEEGRVTAYFFLDTTAERGANYRYQVQGITTDGLTSLSEPLDFHRPRSRGIER